MSHRDLSPCINETHYPSKRYKPVFGSVLYRDGAGFVIQVLLRGQVCQAVGIEAERILPLLPREPGDLALEENTY